MHVVPRIKNDSPWEATIRKQVRSLAKGWSVRESPRSKRVTVEVRPPGLRPQNTTLSFGWNEIEAADAYIRIRNIYALVSGEGFTLKQAAEVAAGKAPKFTEETDWVGAMQRFKDQKLHHGNVIKLRTWLGGYEPVITDAIGLLTSQRPPTSPADLLDSCIREWEPGSRTRQERARNLAQFLRYCVSRERFPSIWQPPSNLTDHIGRKPATAEIGGSDPITDQEIIDVLASFPSDEAGYRWGNAVRLIAELGLRPVELRHLSLRRDPKTKQTYWWCSYQKRSGGGVTKPRKLYALPLVSNEGLIQHWNLLEKWEAGTLELPPMDETSRVALNMAQYLNRREAWKSLLTAAESRNEKVTSYSFRHSYSVRGHQRGLDTSHMSLAMGHNIEVHCRSYPWATESGTEEAFNRAMQNALQIR